MIQKDIFRQDSSWLLHNPFTTIKQRNFYMAMISIKTVDNTYMAIIGTVAYANYLYKQLLNANGRFIGLAL